MDHFPSGEWIAFRSPPPLLRLVVLPLHSAALSKLKRTLNQWRLWADYFREVAKEALTLPHDKPSSPNGNEPLRSPDRVWFALEILTTLVIAAAVIYLVW